jgi:hypothetical protein
VVGWDCVGLGRNRSTDVRLLLGRFKIEFCSWKSMTCHSMLSWALSICFRTFRLQVYLPVKPPGREMSTPYSSRLGKPRSSCSPISRVSATVPVMEMDSCRQIAADNVVHDYNNQDSLVPTARTSGRWRNEIRPQVDDHDRWQPHPFPAWYLHNSQREKPRAEGCGCASSTQPGSHRFSSSLELFGVGSPGLVGECRCALIAV